MSRNYNQDEDPTAATRKLVDAAISHIAEKQESEMKSIETQYFSFRFPAFQLCEIWLRPQVFGSQLSGPHLDYNFYSYCIS